MMHLYRDDGGMIGSGKSILKICEANVDLIRADLKGAVLPEANLFKANLSGADLRWAILVETDLRDADLSGANLTWIGQT